MTTSTLAQFDALLYERRLDSSRLEQLMYGDRVLLGMLEKKGDTGMMGSSMPVPFMYGNPQGAGGAFATAQTNQTNTKSDQWLTTAGSYFGTVAIGDLVLKSSRTNMGAFLSNQLAETDGLYETVAEDLSIYAWGNGGGSLGVRASASTNVITLTNPSDASNFEIDMVVVASANDGSDSAHALRAGSTAVTAVNASAGTITLASAAAITSFSDADNLFRQSDFFGNTGTVIIKGLQAFITPTDVPQALWGVSSATRALQPQRYAGCRVPQATVSNKSYEERLRILGAQMRGRFKSKFGKNMACFMHPEDWQILETVMMARGTRSLTDDSTEFGYQYITVSMGGQMVKVYADRHCPRFVAFVLNMDNFWISSVDEFIHEQNEDGLSMLRKATTTDYELRLLSYPILVNNAPKNSGRVPLN
jgi:hypothetical protein